MGAESTTPHVVVVGLDCITGLQSARIFAQRGVPVVGIAADRHHYAARTRACERVLQADIAGDDLVDVLADLGAELPHRSVLLPCTDLSVMVISRHRSRLTDRFHILLPDHAVVDMLMDKVSFARHAQGLGLPISGTAILHSRDDALAAAATMRFPCVLKPPIKSATWKRNTPLKVIPVAGPAEFVATYDRVAGWADVLLAQEWVDGGAEELYSCNAYFDARSRPLVTFVARKLRQWPPHTGTSSLGEECRNDAVLDATLELFGGAGFHGLAYLEMKRDARTGRHYIIEPNVGRPTGRSAIAEGSGVPLLYTAYCDAVGRELPTGRAQQHGRMKWMDVRHDTQSALSLIRQRELTPARWLASVRGPKCHAVLSRTDPLPFAYELVQASRKALRSFRDRRRSRVRRTGEHRGRGLGVGSAGSPRQIADEIDHGVGDDTGGPTLVSPG